MKSSRSNTKISVATRVFLRGILVTIYQPTEMTRSQKLLDTAIEYVAQFSTFSQLTGNTVLMRCIFFRNWQIRGFRVVAGLYEFSRENGAVFWSTWGAVRCALIGW